ncbi:P-loop containing nucleoside triphosphate hydrolase protein [Guyanagaster necrorhizus]|uniref:P-loop containing nucleoside triphosphate hydrolase protein n=1 Tax=Guyanagaster necrorhizus TaxID=856835 RepID=A0A9P7VYW9_9AGAR|nr:P-loop containing nucleoside triphosphate hydrolase protein [Guyanagaster necrorhizus MCA 3950]KAG7448980.1 P-loop containing nucleoside triphosphate hydrolase protein [Guyanagaster necrorhizus MCA 3950]
MTATEAPKIRWTVHVEVRLKSRATARFETIRHRVHDWIHTFDRINLSSTLIGWEVVPELGTSVDRIVVCESTCPSQSLPLDELTLQVHVYQPSDTDSFEEFSNGAGSKDDEDDTMAASVCELPNLSWEGLWDSLIYADDIKMKLLDYIHATLIFSDADVNFNLVSWNRVVLLHGPPGTGKTSLCRALAQKLSIRLSHRYTNARLLEINAHSLFSKWFSESGKLVQRLFTSITELAEEEDAFLVVLIDEVESLTAARAGAMAGTEPSDGLRVVNALLTQLDKLKHKKNVLVMSTSNLVKAIDSAFVDRADIIQYVDLPSREAIYDILRSSLCEIVNKGLVTPVNVPTLQAARMYELAAPAQSTPSASAPIDAHAKSGHVALKLRALAADCRSHGMSGRALRRLPVLALARYIGISGVSSVALSSPSKGHAQTQQACAGIDQWLIGMERVLAEQAKEKERLS